MLTPTASGGLPELWRKIEEQQSRWTFYLDSSSPKKRLMDLTQTRPERLPFDLGAKPSSQIPSLRQGTYLPMATPSPNNMGVLANKELPRTVSRSSNESTEEKAPINKTMITPVMENAATLKLVDLTSDTDSDKGAKEFRRSRRDKKSTLVYIDGQAVLAKNNYHMKGLAYEYGKDFQTAPPEKKMKTTSNKALTTPKAPKPRTDLETKRINHNTAVKSRVESKMHLRSQYLASHLSSLEPFLDKSVTCQLKQVSNVSTLESAELFIQPSEIQADMRDYQLAGLNWMVRMCKANLGMILGDEMGLGKTLQTISLLCHLKEREGITGPSLVICPLSVLYSWCHELERWAPSLSFLRFHSSSVEEREAQKHSLVERATEYDVVITTYEMAKAPGLRSLWSRQYFNLLVLDEGHRIKDSTNQISQAVRLIHCENSLILTGTPLQNNLVELWSLLNFLYPDVFSSQEPFASAFSLTENVIDKAVLLKAHSMLRCFMLRRLKDEVEKLMPKKVETKVICPLSNTQVFWYKALLLKDINLLARNDDDTPSSATNAKTLSNLVMQLRKCCLHPFLFDGAEVDIDTTTCEDLISASGKLTVLDMLLRSLYEKKHRVVLFSQFTSVLDILDDYCTMRGWKHCRFDGSTPRAKRNFIVNQFNAPDSDYFVFLMSTRSGGMGLNLQTADTCILFDSDWNPQPDIQAAARVHRIGQKKTVHIYRLVCGGTIEERMLERAQKKLFLDQMVNQDSAADELCVSKGELMATLKFGCDAVFGEDSENKNTLPTDHDIAMITDRDRSETFSDGRLKGGATNTASEFKADEKLTATTKLGGIDFKEIRDKHKKNKMKDAPNDIGGIADMWMKVQKRQRKSRIINVEAQGSGYGSKSIPVLAANNYDLENGESSVFQRELGGRKGNFGEIKSNVKKSGVDFREQDFCQVCGDGGLLLCCPRCPVAVHQMCVEIKHPNDFFSCPHHRCSTCHKNVQDAGGLLFPCQSCPISFCEDCLPTKTKGFRILGSCDRFAKLGFDSKHLCYIHCSERCEAWGKKEYQWSLPSTKRASTPTALDLSHAFGKPIDATIDAPEEICESRFRKRKVHNYIESVDIDHSLDIKSAKLETVDPTEVIDITMEDQVHEVQRKSKRSRVSHAAASLPPPSNEEYEVVIPVTPHGLLIMVSMGIDGSTVFHQYRRAPDGSKGPAELNHCVQNVGDRIVAVNQVSTSQLSHYEVVALLRDCVKKKYAKVRFRVSAGSVTSSLPSDSSTGERHAVALADAHLTVETGQESANLSLKSPWLAAPTPLSEGEYDTVLPMSTKYGIMIRVGDLNGSAVFTGYSQYADGGKGPAELRKLIRNEGDRIVAVNGVMTSSFPHVCHLIKESRRNANAYCFIRLREIHSKYSLSKVRERIAPDGSVKPASEPKRTKDGFFLRPAGRTRRGVVWDNARGIWVPSREIHSKYSLSKVRERIAPDGSVKPASEPKRTKDGFFLRPAGRTRRGMVWDNARGIWVPLLSKVASKNLG